MNRRFVEFPVISSYFSVRPRTLVLTCPDCGSSLQEATQAAASAMAQSFGNETFGVFLAALVIETRRIAATGALAKESEPFTYAEVEWLRHRN